MSDVIIDLPLIDDGLIEGPEAFSFALTNATSSTGGVVEVDPDATNSTTIINDTNGEGGAGGEPGQWSVSGPSENVEGTVPQFVISLSGEYGAGEIITVDLGFTDIDTNAQDHSDIIAAIQAAVANNPDVTFDPATGTLIYTAPADGASMTDIVIDLALTDDGLIESPEAFSFELSNASSPTGAGIEINPEAGLLVALVIDAGDPESRWSIEGATETTEIDTPQYTVSLNGTFGQGESVSVELSLSHIDTENNDFDDVLAAFQASVEQHPDLTFTPFANSASNASAILLNDNPLFSRESANGAAAGVGNNTLLGTLTYTSPADGASMADFTFGVPVFDDSLIENPESFVVSLNDSAASGLDIGIDSDNELVETLIEDNDFHVGTEPPIGAVFPSPGRGVVTSDANSEGILEIARISLRKYTTAVSEGIILEAVNRIDSLGSMFGSSGLGIPWIDRLHRDAGPLEDRVLNDRNNEEVSTGFSSGVGYRGTISVDPTDECGRFFIDTIIRDSMLSVIARSTIDPERSSGVAEFSVALASGEPLPDWISEIGDGEYIIDPTVGVDSVVLKLTAHRDSGWGLVRTVEINTLTGEIADLEAQVE